VRNDESTKPAPARSFEEALRGGEAKGYAVCAKPLRFARLPDTVAATFAEIGDANCYFVFQKEADATRRLEQIRPEDQLGWIFSVREIAHLAPAGPNDGPKLDLHGHPFEMRGFLVDQSGGVTEWRHPGKLGWRGPTAVEPDVKNDPPAPGLLQWIASWWRKR
jgi:hypothetical protein